RPLADHLMQGNPTARELKVFLAIVVEVALDRRAWDGITRDQIARRTGLDPSNVGKTIAKLVDRGVIHWTAGGSPRGESRTVSEVGFGRTMLNPLRDGLGSSRRPQSKSSDRGQTGARTGVKQGSRLGSPGQPAPRIPRGPQAAASAAPSPDGSGRLTPPE